ncbi:hypothetical protein MBLNU230_g3420t1 [Neophaeotheca triangularis]
MPGKVIIKPYAHENTVASMPLHDNDRPLKRRRLSSTETMSRGTTPPAHPDLTRIVDDGDLVLVVRGGPDGTASDVDVPLLVSSKILSMSSPYIKSQIAQGLTVQAEGEYGEGPQLVLASNDEQPTMSLLCDILHLQHHRLPTRLTAKALHDLALIATKYQCVQAVSRICYAWFDRLHTGVEPNPEPFQTMEAAYLLDDATSFARFTGTSVLTLAPDITPLHAEPLGQRIALACRKRRTQCINDLRADIDLLADACTFALSDGAKHYINTPVGMEPEEGEPADECEVDKEGVDVFLTALRERKVWPSTLWPQTVGEVVERVRTFQVPEYDDSDGCEFCEGINRVFAMQLALVQRVHTTRLWGLCLDCFKSGEVFQGQCRIEHAKAH